MSSLSVKQMRVGLAEFDVLLNDVPDAERWELLDGRILKMMVGARREHAHIISNLHGLLWRDLRAKRPGCHAYSESSRVVIDAIEASFIPDIVVTCEPIERGATALKAPTIVMEVLSDTTAGRDRGAKWDAYRKIASLRNYVLLESSRPAVEIFDRRDAVWHRRALTGLGAVLDLPALDLSIPLSEIYTDLFA